MPTLNAWKRNLTINRPGHHFRSQVGDMLLTHSVRGVYGSMAATKDAARVLGVANNYRDLDFVQMLNDLHAEEHIAPFTPEAVAKGEHVLTTIRVGGKDVDYTAGKAADALHRNGLKPTYHMGEGLYEDPAMRGSVAKAASFLSLEETGYGKFMGGVSQGRDHFVRAQHFMQIMRQETSRSPFAQKQFKGQWSTIDQLEKLAAKEVKKYHPDASMLTPFESGTMRLIVPFYSWMAKILPAFAESMMRNPGRIAMLPKASYELAVANGLNPDSIYDPFPPDQQFPSYLTGKFLGPQFQIGGKYYGINPGSPHGDLLEDMPGAMSDNPMRAVASLLAPPLKIPAEVASGYNSAGIKIKDSSDYLDQQIPLVNNFASIFGISPTGTLTGEGLRDDNPDTGFIDMNAGVTSGKREGFLNAEGAVSAQSIGGLLNFLFGLGVTPMSRQVDINAAEIGARNNGGK
jgi:hypothetical protein